ncbi:hypothetical protein A2U01_0071911, partial [Trifolium medium]|nr:hypothetical protein [Trifolium medium]
SQLADHLFVSCNQISLVCYVILMVGCRVGVSSWYPRVF